MVWLPFWAFRMLEKGCASVLSARSGIFRTCAFFVGYLSKRFLRWTLDCRCFSSSLTLREVMELLFAVGARRWRLARVLLLFIRFG